MSPSQVQAARILLNKVLPDLKSMELQATVAPVGPLAYELTDEQLLAIAAGALNVVPIQPMENPIKEVQAINPPQKSN